MAYAAVVSLAQILKQLLQSDQLSDKPEIQSLHKNVSSLQSSLQKIILVPKNSRVTVKKLEIQIRDLIYKAQDTIEAFICKAEEIQSTSTSVFLQELQEIIEKISPIAKTTEKLAVFIRKQTGESLSEDTRSNKSNFSTKIRIVGQEKDRKLVTDELKSDASQLQVVPVSGMPGIGKTTLAKSIYEDPDIENHFNMRAWVTVSSDYNVRDIFLKLHASLASKGQKSDDSGSMKNLGDIVNQERSDQLALNLYQKLFNIRFLIVIDDMWEKGVWDEIKQYFPDNKNGSRIILTTRNEEIAEYVVKATEFRHKMSLLSLENSWILLCDKVFEGGDCPPNLKEIGMSIAENCQGLPLSLTVVGGLLAQKKIEEYWKFVGEDTKAAAAKSEEAYLDILALSYNLLPNRLKGCFLYIGAFPEDSDILVSKLIKLWVAEGFLTSSELLEDVAQQYLRDLIARNLLFVRRNSSNGQIKTCGIHDTLRDLAVKECGEEKFFHALNRHFRKRSEGRNNQRRLSIHKNILLCVEDAYNTAMSVKLARTLLCAGPHHHHPIPYSLTYDLLRVLDALTVYFIEFPNEVLKLIQLRYLSFTYNGKLPSSLSKLENLQVLIVRQYPKIIFIGTSILPDEIWNMSQLRHLLFTESELPVMPSGVENPVLFRNLQTLSNVNASCCTKEVLQNIPNLKKLGMWAEEPGSVNFYIYLLEKLESFTFTVLNPDPETKIEFLGGFAFPKKLRKLSLCGCGIPWEDMTVIVELSNLEVLKLREMAFKGEMWCLDGMVFPELKYLLLEYMDLKDWGSEDGDEARYFPSVKRLFVRHCYELNEIPSDIGNIGGLELLELVDCSPSAVESAKEIRKEQKDLKEDFQVRIYSSWE